MPSHRIMAIPKLPKKRFTDINALLVYAKDLRHKLQVRYNAGAKKAPLVFLYEYLDTPSVFCASTHEFTAINNVKLVGQVNGNSILFQGRIIMPKRGVLTCLHSENETCERCQKWAASRVRKPRGKM